jgi:WD40 repeat protein
MRFLQAGLHLAIIALSAIVASPSIAQRLTEVTLFSANDLENTNRAHFWNSNGGSKLGWFLFLRQGNQWLNPVGTDTDIPLTPGVHTFRIYAEPVGAEGYIGLNLFFDANVKAPSISAITRKATSEEDNPPFVVTHGGTMRPNLDTVPGSGTLVYERGAVLVELVKFRVALPAVNKEDRVSQFSTVPNGSDDLVGTLELRVTVRQENTPATGGIGSVIHYKSTELGGLKGIVSYLQFSPDGQRLIAGVEDDPKAVKLWMSKNGQELYTLYDKDGILSTLFSPDSKYILTSIGNNTARVWDVATGRPLATLVGHTGPIACMTFTTDSRFVATGSYDTTIKIWATKTGREVFTLKGHTAAITSLVFAPDGKSLVSGSADKTVRVWDVARQLKPTVRQ